MDSWNDKVAVVTGGASGIGAAFARLVSRNGGNVVICDTNVEAGLALADELGGQDKNVVFVRTDVCCLDDLTKALDGAAERYGRIDAMFNNAGIAAAGSVAELDEATFDKVVKTDLYSIFFGCKAALKHMEPAGKGAILNMSSVSGMYGDYGVSAYNAAKGGVINLSRAVALDYASKGIRVNVICPGTIETPLFATIDSVPGLGQAYINTVPAGRIGTSEEVAEVAAFLLSDKASYMTGAVITVDGGLTAKTGFPGISQFTEHLKNQF